VRINQLVAAATGLSRRAADTAVTAGRVTVAGRPAQLGETVNDPGAVRFDGQPLVLPKTHTYVMFHKPVGYVSSRTRQGDDPTLYELLPPSHHALRIAGRLDRDSSGLILLSDDGDFIHKHTHPSFSKAKIYDLKLARPLTASAHKQLESGVKLIDGLSRLTVLQVDGNKVKVSLSEGRNRQLRRTFGKLGYTVETLRRIQMGPYTLGDLEPGHWQEVAPL
jgi:23S rRNA pseudouridine2605 synthase